MTRALIPCLLVGLPCVAGCGVAEGDYLVYRVGLEQFTETDACYFPEEMKPPDVIADSNSHLAPATWVVYFASGDRIVLDTGTSSLEGEETDEGFTFTGHAIDVTYLGVDQQEAKLTATSRITLDMQVDGDAIAGEALQLTTITCDFLTATPSDGLCEATPSCERRGAFAGVRLEDVEITSGVDKSNPI